MAKQQQLKNKEPTQVVNITDQRVRFHISVMAGAPARTFDLGPGESAELEAGYALRRQASPERDIQPSIIEQLTCGKVLPIGDPRAKEALRAREVTRMEHAAPALAVTARAPKAENDELTPPGEVVAAASKGRR